MEEKKETRAKAKEGDKRIGNEFWKARLTDGREKIFATPESYWEAAIKYFQWVEDNPLNVAEPIKSGDKAGELMYLPKARAMTLMGLAIFLGVDVRTLNNYHSNDGEYKEFFPISTCIREIIRNQKLEGAASGLFNANIIAMELGMKDKKEISGSMAVVWNEQKVYKDGEKDNDE